MIGLLFLFYVLVLSIILSLLIVPINYVVLKTVTKNPTYYVFDAIFIILTLVIFQYYRFNLSYIPNMVIYSKLDHILFVILIMCICIISFI